MKQSESLSATDFFDKLQQDKLDTNGSITLSGMVKKPDGKERSLQFAPLDCSNWVSIPLEFIEGVEMVSSVPCKDHVHPFVKLNLTTPKTPEGKMLGELLEGMCGMSNAEISNGADMDTNGGANPPGSMARRRPRFGGVRTGMSNSTCLWTWVDKWVCTTEGNTTTCGWVGSWQCI